MCRHFAVVAFLLQSVLVPSPGLAQQLSGEELLDSLRGWDQVFAQGIYVESDVVMPPSPFDSDVPARAIQVRCTWWDNNHAIEQSFVAQIPGTSQPAVFGGGHPQDSREAIPLKRFYVFDHGKSSSYESVAVEIADDGKPLLSGETQEIVLLYNPDSDNDITPELHRLKWSLGRGFSEHFDHIGEVREEDSGLLHVSATGRWRPGEKGRWELLIDPQAGLLVRKAEFYNRHSGRRVFTVSTEGTLDVGGWIAARKGKFALRLRTRDLEYEYSHQVILSEPDVEFYEATDAVFNQPFPNMTIVHDNRGKEEKITRIGANHPGSRPTSPQSSSGGSMGLLTAINLVAVAIVLLLLGIRAAKKQPKPPNSH